MSREEGNHDARKEGTAAAVEDARHIARQHRDEGWTAVVVPAVDTSPVPEAAEKAYSGFVHVVPASLADEVAAACEQSEFPRYDVYRRRVGGEFFFVVELLDADTETALLIAGTYRVADAAGLYRQADREGVVRTHLTRLNGEHLGAVEHEVIEKLFPDGMDALAGRS